MDMLIVDGYNVISAWPELHKLKEINMDQARERLIQWMASYAGFKGLEVVIVFDAYMAKGDHGRYCEISGVQVVFSPEGETADSVIEKITYDFINKGRRNVFVVTADWAEQITILVSGAFRLSVGELRSAVLAAAQEISDRHGETESVRRTLEGRLQRGVIQRLEEIRRGKRLRPPEKR